MDAPPKDEKYQELVRCLRTYDYGRLEDIWLEVCDKQDVDLDALCAVADELAERGQTDRAGTLLLTALTPLADHGAHGEGLGVVQRAIRHARDPEEARAFAIEAYGQAMADRPGIQDALDLSGLRGGTPLKQALDRLDSLLFVAPGDFVFHDGGWRIGRVASVDVAGQSVIVDFEVKPGHRISSQLAPKILRKVSEDDFDVMRWQQPQALRAMAEEDPAGLVRALLRSEGRRMSSKEIKARIAGTAVDPAHWSKWWSAARRWLQKDPYIEADGQQFLLRDEALTPEHEALEQMRAANTLPGRMAAAVDYLKKSDRAERTPEALGEMCDLVAEAAVRQSSPAQKIEAAFLVEDLHKAGAVPTADQVEQPVDLVASVTDVSALMKDMSYGDYQRRALRLLRETRPDDWPVLFEEVLFDSPRELWDFIVRELLEGGHGGRASDACLRVATDHSRHADLYLWLCRCAFSGRFDAVLGGHDEFVLLENLLSLLAELADPRRRAPGDVKKLLGRGKDVLSVKDYDHVRRIIDQSSEDEARRIRDLVAYNRGLSEPTRRGINGVLLDRHPSLFERPEPDEEEQPIFTTPAGLKRLQEEYDRLMNVELPANQRALGAAIGFGDVSDNAELRVAREEQAHLTERADHLATQLRRVQILDRHHINTDQVSPGTQVAVRNIDTDQEQTLTVLGPWDADPDAGVISHIAPLAQSLLGAKPGDRVRAQVGDAERHYEVLSIVRADW